MNPVPVFRAILRLFLLLTGLFLIFLLYAQMTMYKPPEQLEVFSSDRPDPLSRGVELSLMIWNLGYAGMGSDMDFFYDGGRLMRTSRQRTHENLQGMMDVLENHREMDFFLLQEVDYRSRRSYGIHMPDSIKEALPHHIQSFGINYQVRFVPVPLRNPMGRVNSGILTASRATPAISSRFSFPGGYQWPVSLFNLQRCFLMNRYPMEGGGELVVINTHNSAFDDGSLRYKQMRFMEEIMLREYDLGNYVIAGGDFNLSPPGFEPAFNHNIFDDKNLVFMPGDLLPGWQLVYDARVPTNRRAYIPYDPTITPTTLIDFYILSPNVEIVQVEGLHLDFLYTDHNPVIARVRLN